MGCGEMRDEILDNEIVKALFLESWRTRFKVLSRQAVGRNHVTGQTISGLVDSASCIMQVRW